MKSRLRIFISHKYLYFVNEKLFLSRSRKEKVKNIFVGRRNCLVTFVLDMISDIFILAFLLILFSSSPKVFPSPSIFLLLLHRSSSSPLVTKYFSSPNIFLLFLFVPFILPKLNEFVLS